MGIVLGMNYTLVSSLDLVLTPFHFPKLDHSIPISLSDNNENSTHSYTIHWPRKFKNDCSPLTGSFPRILYIDITKIL